MTRHRAAGRFMMSMENTHRPVLFARETYAFMLLLVASAAVYLFRLGYSDIWIDESLSKAIVRHSFPDVVRLVAHDSHPPLYFVALKGFAALVGNTNLTIRLFSVLGALTMLVASYAVGRRVFGRGGALCLAVLLLALPISGIYTHVARMYTWAAFMTLCVFLYATLYARERRPADLAGLCLASIGAAYTHYYCLAAAFWINVALLACLLAARDRAWRRVALMGVVVFLAYLPWVFVLVAQAETVRKDFWIPPVSWGGVWACYVHPFGGFYRLYEVSRVMAVVVYGFAVVALVAALASRKRGGHHPLTFALVGFHATVATAVVVSLCFRPVLYPRYLAAIAPLLMVPPVVVMMRWRAAWPKPVVLGGLVACGLSVVLAESTFSYGPNEAALDHLRRTQPEVVKILHLNEVTAGPLAEYGRGHPWRQYYLNNAGTSWYSNMEAFDELTSVQGLGEVVEIGEVFCLAEFAGLPLNGHNMDAVVSRCDPVTIAEIRDTKADGGFVLKLRILRRRL